MTASDGDFEPYTAATRAELERAAGELVHALEAHAATLRTMTGRATELDQLIQVNDAVGRQLAEWSERVFDYTGSTPIVLASPEEEAMPNRDTPSGVDSGRTDLSDTSLTIIARWDVNVSEPEALIEAGRSAYLRLRPSESWIDAEFAVRNVSVALSQLLHELGEPLENLRDIQLVRGVRAFVWKTDVGHSERELDPNRLMEEPAGLRQFTEFWG